jgi:hypothetical protein
MCASPARWNRFGSTDISAGASPQGTRNSSRGTGDILGTDPLSLHILERSGNDTSGKVRPKDGTGEDVPARSRQSSLGNELDLAVGAGSKQTESGQVAEVVHSTVVKEKRRTPRSMFSRLIGMNLTDSEDEDTSFEDTQRTEGNDAQAFAQPAGVPSSKPATPRYIRVSFALGYC